MSIDEIMNEINEQLREINFREIGVLKRFEVFQNFKIFSLLPFEEVESVYVNMEQKTIQLN